MNGLIRLALHADPKTMTSPFENMPGLLEADQFTASFADAFAAIEDGESELSPLETADLDNENPEPLKLDFDIPFVPAEKNDELEVLPAQEVEYETEESSQPLERPIDEKPLPEDIRPPVETLQRHAMVRDVQTEPLPVSGRKESRVTFDKLEQPTPRSADLPGKENAAQHIENVTPKDKQIFSDASLTKHAGKQPEPKIGSTEDNTVSPARAAVQASPAPLAVSAVPSATAFVMPTTITATPNIAPVIPTAAPSTPILNIEMDDQWVAKLSQDIGQLTADKSALSFQLKPHHLGKMHVEITTDSAGDVVRLETDNENAKALIIGSQGRLEQDIRLSGIKLARVDVTLQEQPGSQFDERGSGAQESRSESGRDHNSGASGHLAQHQSLSENRVTAASPNHGARYA